MIILLIDQRLFLCEQYLALQEVAEAQMILIALEEQWEQFTPEQSQRMVQLFATLETDELFIRYFEAGHPIETRHTKALVFAYAREGMPEAAQVLISQLPIEQQAEIEGELAQLFTEQHEQQAKKVVQLLGAMTPNWEQVLSCLTSLPQLWQYQEIVEILQEKVACEGIRPPYLALLVDLGLQQGQTFRTYPMSKPLQETEWVQTVERAIIAQRLNPQLFQELATMKILTIYPKTPEMFGYKTVDDFIATIQSELQDMLTMVMENE